MNALDYCRQVVDRKLALRAIQPSSARDYRISLNAWEPHIGSLSLGELTPHILEGAIAEWIADGISPNTAIKRHVALSMALRQAVKEKLLEENPLDSVPKPRREPPQPNPIVGYDLERLKMLLASLSLRPWVVAVHLCLYAGLRSEEACALKATDIDLPSGLGYVRRAVGYGDGGAYIAPTKTRRMRDFPICDQLADVLGRWQDGRSRRGWLLGDSKWLDPRMVGRKWSALCDMEDYIGLAGRKPTLHDLRHTFATACVRARMDVKTLQSILGHSSASMTLDVYASADPDAKSAARALIGAAI